MKINYTMSLSLVALVALSGCGGDSGIAIPNNFTTGSLDGTYTLNGTACSDGSKVVTNEALVDKSIAAWVDSYELNKPEVIKSVVEGDEYSHSRAKELRERLLNEETKSVVESEVRKLYSSQLTTANALDESSQGSSSSVLAIFVDAYENYIKNVHTSKMTAEVNKVRDLLNAKLSDSAKANLAKSMEESKDFYDESAEREELGAPEYLPEIVIADDIITTRLTNKRTGCVQSVPGRISYLEEPQNSIRLSLDSSLLATCSETCTPREQQRCDQYNADIKRIEFDQNEAGITQEEKESLQLDSVRTFAVNRSAANADQLVWIRLTNLTKKVRTTAALKEARTYSATDGATDVACQAPLNVGYVFNKAPAPSKDSK